MMLKAVTRAAAALVASMALATAAAAACPATHDALVQALRASVAASGGPMNGGLENHQWAAVVGRENVVCAVAFSGAEADDQWPGSRAIAAEKAATANALSLDGMAMSTANLYAGTLPGGILFGLEATDPPDPAVIHAGPAASFGTPADPMLGKVTGGVVVFGGGLALYDTSGVVGGLGVSGDTSCADHNVAWRVRLALGLAMVPKGVGGERKDAIIYDLNHDNKSASGFGHPKCPGTEADIGAEIGASIGGESLK